MGGEVKVKLEAWKGVQESKGLRLNVKKTKIMIKIRKPDKFGKKGSFLVEFGKIVQIVISSSASLLLA